MAAGLPIDVAGPLAAKLEELGYASAWSNDTPMASGLETLANFAHGSDQIDLGVAVIALDRHTPAEINEKIDSTGLDRDRLWLGIGAGFSKKPLTRMRECLPTLREEIPGVRLVLAAMGPKMCALGGAEFDGVFFNWMSPEFSEEAAAHVRAGAADAGRDTPPIFGYVRTAVGPDAIQRLGKEESFYRDLHDGYRDHFDRLDEPEGSVGVAAIHPEDADPELSQFTALDTIVVRGLASAKLEAMTNVAEASAPTS